MNSKTGTPRRQDYALLEGILGIRVSDGADLAALAVNRVCVAVIDRLMEHGLHADELSLFISRGTLTRRRQRHERLSAEESDKTIRLARIVARAAATFGDPQKALRWLRTPHARFAGCTALSITSTEHGARSVEEALVQIDEGYFA